MTVIPVANLYGHEIAVLKCLLDREGKIRLPVTALIELEGVPLDVGRRRGGQADVKRIEMGERGLPRAVDGAVAFVSNNHIEIAAGEFRVSADHGLEQADRDLLFLSNHARAQPVTAVLVQDVLNSFKRLLGELLSIHQEQDSLGASGLDEPLEIQANEIGLARAGGQLDQETALAQLHRMIERLHGLPLVGPHLAGLTLAEVIFGDFNRRERLAGGPHLHQSLEIATGEERIDDASVVVAVVPEINQFAIGQEDEWRADLLGIGQGLLFGSVRFNGSAFGLDDSQGATAAI